MKGIVYSLGELLEEPYKTVYSTLPYDAFEYGGGGFLSTGSLCGGLNGALQVIALFTDAKNRAPVGQELLFKHNITPYPSDNIRQYVANRELGDIDYGPEYIKKGNPPGSELCHIIVSKYCREQGYSTKSAEWLDYCTSFTADVGAMTVELLNAYADGTFKTVTPNPATAAGCLDCHSRGDDYTVGNFAWPKAQDCRVCHVDPLLAPHNK
jgi:hypothetical protein